MEDPRPVSMPRPSGSTAPDEVAAADARRRYKSEGMAALVPDPLIAPLLGPGEEVLAVRRCVTFERLPSSDGRACAGRGALYLTSARLVLIGQATIAINLDDIEEAILTGARLLLALREAAGISLEIEQPELLRLEIATARVAGRS